MSAKKAVSKNEPTRSSGSDSVPCWAEFNVEIRRDGWNREKRMAKDFEFRTQDANRDIPIALAIAYEFASLEKWDDIEMIVKRLDDPDAVDLLPTIDETRKILLPNAPDPAWTA